MDVDHAGPHSAQRKPGVRMRETGQHQPDRAWRSMTCAQLGIKCSFAAVELLVIQHLGGDAVCPAAKSQAPGPALLLTTLTRAL